MTETVVRAETARSRDYTAFMRCDSGDRWLSEAEAQVSSWLRSRKSYDVPLNVSEDFAQSHSTLSVRRLTDDGRDDLRIRLTEHQENTGTWTTEFIAHDEAVGNGWIHLTVRNDQGRFVAVPGLARFLMQVLPLADGGIAFSDKPDVFHEQDIERLVSLLADEHRHGLVLVAGSELIDDLPFDPYVRKVRDWASQVYGLAQVVVLDPAATRAFARRVGDRYAAPAWCLRTYRPGVAFGDPTGFRRHRILGTRQLAERPDHVIRRLLGDIVRQQAATRPADPDVRRVQRRFDRNENRRLVEAVEVEAVETTEFATVVEPPSVIDFSVETPETPLDETIAEQEAQLALVKRVLRIPAVTEQDISDAVARIARHHTDRQAIKALEQRVEELQLTVFALEDDNTVLGEALDDSQMETQLVRFDLDDRDARIRWLQSRLREQGDYEALYSDVPPEFLDSRPDNFEELLERVDKLEGVVFTGDLDEVAKLDQYDANNAALYTAWDSVLCLADYVKARASSDWNSGLDQYIRNTPAGYRTISPGKWGSSETSMTMNAYGDERVFPVPESVHPAGEIAMKAHFKLASIGMRSPRMYVHDGHPAEQCVFIGYIGAHLTNTRTN